MRALAFGALVLDDSLPNGGSLEVFGSLDDLGENRPTVVMVTVPRAALAEAQKHTPERMEYVATPECESDTERLALRVRSRLMNATVAAEFDAAPQHTDNRHGLSSTVPQDFPVRRSCTGSALLALGLIMLGAWYILGTGAMNVHSRDEQARLVPTAQIEAQRPMAVPTSPPASTPVTTSAQVDPSPTATRTQLAVRTATMSRQSNDARVGSPTPTVRPANTPPSTNTPVSGSAVNQQVVADPVRFVIDTPAIRVNAPVEYVGLTAERAMEAPKGWWNVGWYERGPKPGEQGNAVIAGHLDSESGPAVFWQLDKIRVGDEVRVVDVQGSTIRFRVREIQVYFNEDAPLTKIFGHTDGAHLNLITCDGFFDRNAGIYDRRLVVYTDRVS
jgi:LPXTG-site transpeptidase (sortase) family protein